MRKIPHGGARLSEYEVTFEIHERHDSLLIVATCGQSSASSSLSHQAKHDRTDEQFAKDIEDRKHLTGLEAAGKEHSRLQRDKLFAKDNKEIPQPDAPTGNRQR